MGGAGGKASIPLGMPAHMKNCEFALFHATTVDALEGILQDGQLLSQHDRMSKGVPRGSKFAVYGKAILRGDNPDTAMHICPYADTVHANFPAMWPNGEVNGVYFALAPEPMPLAGRMATGIGAYDVFRSRVHVILQFSLAGILRVYGDSWHFNNIGNNGCHIHRDVVTAKYPIGTFTEETYPQTYTSANMRTLTFEQFRASEMGNEFVVHSSVQLHPTLSAIWFTTDHSRYQLYSMLTQAQTPGSRPLPPETLKFLHRYSVQARDILDSLQTYSKPLLWDLDQAPRLEPGEIVETSWPLPSQTLRVETLLGHGMCGEVWRVSDTATRTHMVMKQDLARPGDPDKSKATYEELEKYLELQGPLRATLERVAAFEKAHGFLGVSRLLAYYVPDVPVGLGAKSKKDQHYIPYPLQPYVRIFITAFAGSLSSSSSSSVNVPQLAADALTGLEFLHQVGNCLHVDLKPDNICVDEHGRYYLVDFGSLHFDLPVFPDPDKPDRANKLAAYWMPDARKGPGFLDADGLVYPAGPDGAPTHITASDVDTDMAGKVSCLPELGLMSLANFQHCGLDHYKVGKGSVRADLEAIGYILLEYAGGVDLPYVPSLPKFPHPTAASVFKWKALYNKQHRNRGAVHAYLDATRLVCDMQVPDRVHEGLLATYFAAVFTLDFYDSSPSYEMLRAPFQSALSSSSSS